MLNKSLWFYRPYLYKIMVMHHWLRSGAFFIIKIIYDFVSGIIENVPTMIICSETSRTTRVLLCLDKEHCQQN